MNTNYGKLVNGAIIYAPSSLNTPAGLIVNPKRLSYLQAGWKFLDLQPPADPPPEGKEYTITGYAETDHDIQANFKLIPLVTPPRTFSKLRLINALMSRNLWPAHPLARPSGSPSAKVPSASLRCMSVTGSTPPAITTSSSPRKTSAKIIRNSPPPFQPPNPASISPTPKPPRFSPRQFHDIVVKQAILPRYFAENRILTVVFEGEK